jgi:undecaprenyl-diphosphatase
MTYWQGIVLGVVQGLTEFLPISSSGHLVVAEAAVGLTMPGVLVEVALHVATLLAVVIVYRDRLLRLAGGAVRGKRDAWRYIGLLVLGSVPAGIVGVLFAGFFESLFDALAVVGVDFLITGAILWSTRSVIAKAQADTPSGPGALAIGVGQALAIFPGISRSGTTVAAGLWLGVDPVKAAEYSFLLAIPAIGGAAILQLPHLEADIAMVGAGPLAVSFIASLVSGIIAIRLLVALLQRRAFHRFAPYCWAVGLVTLAWVLIG